MSSDPAQRFILTADTIDAVASVARQWSRGARHHELQATLPAWRFLVRGIQARIDAERAGNNEFTKFRADHPELAFAAHVLQTDVLPALTKLSLVSSEHNENDDAAALLLVAGVTSISLNLLRAVRQLELRCLHFALPTREQLQLAAITRAAGDLPESVDSLLLFDVLFPDPDIFEFNATATTTASSSSVTTSSLLPDTPLLEFAGAAIAGPAAAEEDGADLTAAPTKAPASPPSGSPAFDPSSAFSTMLQRGVAAANLSPLVPFVSNLPGCPTILSRRALRHLRIVGGEASLSSILRAPHLACVANTLVELEIATTVFSGGGAAGHSASMASNVDEPDLHLWEELHQRKQEEQEAAHRQKQQNKRLQHQQQERDNVNNMVASPLSSSSAAASPPSAATTAAPANNTTVAASSANSDTRSDAPNVGSFDDLLQEERRRRYGRPLEVPLARAGTLNQSMRVNNYFQTHRQSQQQQNNNTAAPAVASVAASSLTASVAQRTMWPLLTRLTLRGLRWRTVSPVIGTLPALTHVDLSDNQISTLLEPFPVLAHNTHLTTVNLSRNRLRYVGSGSDAGLPSSVTAVDLSHNFIETLNRGGFPLGLPVLVALREINLSYNLLLFWSDVHALVHRSWTLRRIRVDHNPFADAYLADSAPAQQLVVNDIRDALTAPPPVAGERRSSSSLSNSGTTTGAAAAGALDSSASSAMFVASTAKGTFGMARRPSAQSNANTAAPAAAASSTQQPKSIRFFSQQDLALLMLAYTDPACPQLETNGLLVKRSDADFARATRLARLHAAVVERVPFSSVNRYHHLLVENAAAAEQQNQGEQQQTGTATGVAVSQPTESSLTATNLHLLAPPARHDGTGRNSNNRTSTPSGVGGRVIVRRVVRRVHRSPRRSNSAAPGCSRNASSCSSKSSSSRSSNRSAGVAKQQKQQQSEQQQDVPSKALANITTTKITTPRNQSKHSSNTTVHLRTPTSGSSNNIAGAADHHTVAADPDAVDVLTTRNKHHLHHHHHSHHEHEESSTAAAAKSAQPAAATAADPALLVDRFAHLHPQLHKLMERLTSTLFASEDSEHIPSMFAHPPQNVHSGALLLEVLYSSKSEQQQAQPQETAPSVSRSRHRRTHSKQSQQHQPQQPQPKYVKGASFIYCIGVAEETRCWRAALLKRPLPDDLPEDHEAALDAYVLAAATSNPDQPQLLVRAPEAAAAGQAASAANAGWQTVCEFFIGDPLANGGATKRVAVTDPADEKKEHEQQQQHQQHRFKTVVVSGDFRAAVYVAVSGPGPQLLHADHFLQTELRHACADMDHHHDNNGTSTTTSSNNNAASSTPTTLAVSVAAGGRRPWPIEVIADLFHKGAVDGFSKFFIGERLPCVRSVVVRNPAATVAIANNSNSDAAHQQQQQPEQHSGEAEVQQRRILFQPFERICDRIPPYDFGSSLPALVPSLYDHSVAVYASCVCPGATSASASSAASVAVVHRKHMWAEFVPERLLHLTPQDTKLLRRHLFPPQQQQPQQQQKTDSKQQTPQISPRPSTATTSTAAKGDHHDDQQQQQEQRNAAEQHAHSSWLSSAGGYLSGYFRSAPATTTADKTAAKATTSSAPSSKPVSKSNSHASLAALHLHDNQQAADHLDDPFLCHSCFPNRHHHPHLTTTAATTVGGHHADAQQQQQQEDVPWWTRDVRDSLSHVSVSADGGSLTLYAVHLGASAGISGPQRLTLTTNNASATYTLLWQLRNAMHPVKVQVVVEPIEVRFPSTSGSTATTTTTTTSNNTKSAAKTAENPSSTFDAPVLIGESLARSARTPEQRLQLEERLRSTAAGGGGGVRHIEGCALSIVEPKWVGASDATLSSALLQLEAEAKQEREKREAIEKAKKQQQQQQQQQDDPEHAADKNNQKQNEMPPAQSDDHASAAAAIVGGGILSGAGHLFSSIATTSLYFLGLHHGDDKQHSHVEEDSRTRKRRELLQHQPDWLQFRAPGSMRWSAGWFCELRTTDTAAPTTTTMKTPDGKQQVREDDRGEQHDSDLFAFVVETPHSKSSNNVDDLTLAHELEKDRSGASPPGRQGRVAAILTREDIAVVEVPAACGLEAKTTPLSARGRDGTASTTTTTTCNERDEAEAQRQPFSPLVFILSMRCAGGPDMLVCVAAQQRSPLLRMLRKLCFVSKPVRSLSDPLNVQQQQQQQLGPQLELQSAVNILPVTSWEERLPEHASK